MWKQCLVDLFAVVPVRAGFVCADKINHHVLMRERHAEPVWGNGAGHCDHLPVERILREHAAVTSNNSAGERGLQKLAAVHRRWEVGGGAVRTRN